jgi:hypothetical protein
MAKTEKAKPVARLTLVVEYDTLPADDEIDRVLDAAREYGAVVSAEFETLQLVKRDVKHGVR